MQYQPDGRFSWFLEEFGEPNKQTKVDESIFLKYQDKLPSQLMTYWKEYGFCSFKDGLFSIVNPDEYRSSMIEWIHKTEAFNQDRYHVIARSGFGDLFLWGEKEGAKYIIEAKDGRIFMEEGDADRISKNKADEAIQGFFAILDPEEVDILDLSTDRAIFAQAVKKFGPLEADEMFTFEPALFLGGSQKLENVNKVNVFIQLEILAKMGTPEIMDLDKLTKKAFGVDS